MSYNTEDYDVDISIALNNGVYVFTPDSGTGKTFLYKKLSEYSRLGEPVYGISYNDYKDKILDLIRIKQSKIIMIDRYDLYVGSLEDLIEELKNTSIILVDIKKPLLMHKIETDYVTIRLKPHRIEVL